MKFSAFNLNKDLVSVLHDLHYNELTSIQELSLKDALKGKSLLCKSATGSGKTHAFLIPIIENINPTFLGVQDVIIVPTVELCIQCHDFLVKIENKYPKFKSILLTSIGEKEDIIKKIVNTNLPVIIVSTPGKMLDILNSKKPFQMKISTLIYDEADMLFEDSYKMEVMQIYNFLRPKQVLIYTATMKEHEIASLKKSLNIDKVISANEIRTSSNVTHQIINIRHVKKGIALENYLKIVKPYFALVFSSSKKDIVSIYTYFVNKGYTCYLLTGGKESRERKAMIKKLQNNEINLLFASDVASRGIDFNNISHVISLDLPLDIDYYYHRAGRTGRLDKLGISAIFVNNEKNTSIDKLKKHLTFEEYILKENDLKRIDERNVKCKKTNQKLEREIQIEIRKSKSKIKPCYKKKRRTAAIIVKKRHKKKIIKENIIQSKKQSNN